MPIPDHYRTLGVAPQASLQEIKRAYRALAHTYHPDKNPDDRLAAARFLQVKEAYIVLADERRRRLYDEERYFAGLSARKEPQAISSSWILNEARKLQGHMQRVDSDRMNHGALHDYLLLLLSDAHLAVLRQDDGRSVHKELIQLTLDSIRKLRKDYYAAIIQRLNLVVAEDPELTALLATAYRGRMRAAAHERYLPLLVILITLILCLCMYLFGRQTL